MNTEDSKKLAEVLIKRFEAVWAAPLSPLEIQALALSKAHLGLLKKQKEMRSVVMDAKQLSNLKEHKEQHGETDFYLYEAPLAWDRLRKSLAQIAKGEL